MVAKALLQDPNPGVWQRMQWLAEHDTCKSFGVDLSMITAVTSNQLHLN